MAMNESISQMNKNPNARLSIFFSRFSNRNQRGSQTSRTSWLRTIRHYCFRFWFCLSGNDNYKRTIRKRASRFGINSRSELDVFARIAFPVSFALFNILYWYYFLHLQR
jgi:hypothetical protein